MKFMKCAGSTNVGEVDNSIYGCIDNEGVAHLYFLAYDGVSHVELGKIDRFLEENETENFKPSNEMHIYDGIAVVYVQIDGKKYKAIITDSDTLGLYDENDEGELTDLPDSEVFYADELDNVPEEVVEYFCV